MAICMCENRARPPPETRKMVYLELPVFGLRLVGGGPEGETEGGGARQGAKISKIGAQI